MTQRIVAPWPLHGSVEGPPEEVPSIGRFGDKAPLFRLAAPPEGALPGAHKPPPLPE